MTGSVPLSIAVTAGGLAVVNPCSFPLLPAFLSFYVGAEEERLPAASTRVAQGLVVGGLVASGFLGAFAVVGLPIALGLGALSNAVPWVGLATGGALALAGLVALAGGDLSLPVGVPHLLPRRKRRLGAMLLFGVGYGVASLGCTLPVFFALVGASLGAEKLAIFAAYGAGMAVVLTALSLAAAFAREGIARALRPVLPHVGRIAGALLIASGCYLVYYWARLHFGNDLTVADDPVVGFAARYSGQLENWARLHGTPLISAAAVAVALAVAAVLLRRVRGAKELADR
jgi:cytochrome c-type biogenesis protein